MRRLVRREQGVHPESQPSAAAALFALVSCNSLRGRSRYNPAMVKKVKCPTCSRLAPWSPDNAWRPFCSERCRQIDLGAWAADKFAIPGAPLEADELTGDGAVRFSAPHTLN
ncbi:DNA gyrase inhibitor YacG [Pigmentiphaga humi]|uniref:DNA gyrase inhibitor YacG n=2 Tax=Pigmentiphaga humi TaxID=2478468 RepID=A0A3P4B2D2_9BURK|nr:DNA gyrase inhibitor YacG [Pigmentiphaga humi]